MASIQTKIALSLSALTLGIVGILVVFAPAFLYGLNNIALDPSAAMMSEIRAPGVPILAGCILAIAGLKDDRLVTPALILSAVLLLSYAVGRLISLPMDGIPPASLLAALAIELALGLWCALIVVNVREPAQHAG
ncbi:DUF4345 domain-containing protein [uncultured Roseibium sp.]|uniref:DUF4345 domain-containing protein n=1 Tax=uncultured Roseibium sp. TaxID=1936171 RepID=UPI0026318A1F|nr:DUF4345 domain-containing protein [uncultured Roseibium sp.]